MKIPLFWLKNYIKTDEKAADIAKVLTSIGYMLDKPIYKVGEDEVMDLEVRQNRSDCLSVVGVARELSAKIGEKLNLAEIDESAHTAKLEIGNTAHIKFDIKNSEKCYRFKGMKIEGVDNSKPTHAFMKRALETSDMKSISPVVDITNFVMLKLGEPLHAMDADLIGSELVIRDAENGEEMETLLGTKVKLTKDDLVVSDENGIVTIAGIVGSTYGAVSKDTKNIILEAAAYNQSSVRRSSIRHGIRNESSTRHEKFLHPELVEMALLQAAVFILEDCGGRITAIYDCYPKTIPLTKIPFDPALIRRIGGVDIDEAEIVRILSSLDFILNKTESGYYDVTVPYFRTDVLSDYDLVEEILRIYGYENIPSTLPSSQAPKYIQSKYFDFEEKIRNILNSLNYNEVISDPLTDRNRDNGLNPIVLENSLNADKTSLRTDFTVTLGKYLNSYKKHSLKKFGIFEIGKIYHRRGKEHAEIKALGGYKYNEKSSVHEEYFALKGHLENLFSELGIKFEENLYNIETIDDATLYFQIDLEQLIRAPRIESRRVLTYVPHKLASDISMTVPLSVKVGEIINTVKKGSDLTTSVELGENPYEKDGRKSVLLHISYFSKEPLSRESISSYETNIRNELVSKFNAILR